MTFECASAILEYYHGNGQTPLDHPVAPGIVVTNSLDPRGFESRATKDGAMMGHGSYDVAEDGNTMTATVAGIDSSGKAFEQVIVFDRGA